MSQLLPRVLLVVGPTCVGKSALAVTLARRFNGELISADAIQCYTHIPVAANKVKPADTHGIVHHCIATTSIDRQLTVHDFRAAVSRLVTDIASRGKRAVIVGGNLYWSEACTIQSFVQEHEQHDEEEEAKEPELAPSPSRAPSDNTPRLPLLTSVEELVKTAVAASADAATTLTLEASLTALNADQFSSFLTAVRSHPLSELRHFAELLSVGTTLSSPRLHELLAAFDATRAVRLHRNDRRKIQRALQVFAEHGQSHSSLLAQAHDKPVALLYDAAMIWLDCDRTELDRRIRDRVDSMLAEGLLDECQELYDMLMELANDSDSPMTVEQYQRQCEREYKRYKELDPHCQICPSLTGSPLPLAPGMELDTTRGVCQAMGFKEFLPLLQHRRRVSRQQAESNPALEARLLAECVEALKRSTCRYAKKQDTWIQHRMKSNPRVSAVLPVYRLDATSQSASDWRMRVEEPAVQIFQSLIDGKLLPADTFDSLAVSLAPLRPRADHGSEWKKYECQVCGIEAHGQHEWNIHRNGRKHARAVRRSTNPFYQAKQQRLPVSGT